MSDLQAYLVPRDNVLNTQRKGSATFVLHTIIVLMRHY